MLGGEGLSERSVLSRLFGLGLSSSPEPPACPMLAILKPVDIASASIASVRRHDLDIPK